MTRQRRQLLVALAVLALGGVLALPGVHWRLIGWWRGEHVRGCWAVDLLLGKV